MSGVYPGKLSFWVFVALETMLCSRELLPSVATSSSRALGVSLFLYRFWLCHLLLRSKECYQLFASSFPPAFFSVVETNWCTLLWVSVFFKMNTERILGILWYPWPLWRSPFGGLYHRWRNFSGKGRRSYRLENRHLNLEFIFSSGYFLTPEGLASWMDTLYLNSLLSSKVITR